MIKIKNSKIIKYKLPKTGQLATGESVSGYNKLPLETLKNEGWLPVEEDIPDYNEETQYIVPVEYEVLHDRVIKHYEVKDLDDIPVNSENKAASLMKAVRDLIIIDDLSKEDIDRIKYVYPKWNEQVGEEIKKDEIYLYKDELYRVLDNHKVEEHLNPVDANYLFVSIGLPGVVEEWEQRDYRNPYMVGDKVKWNGEIYECTVDKTTHNPSQAPRNWKIVK